MKRKNNYSLLINLVESHKTIEIIGKIDVKTTLKRDLDGLLYMFPLIERIVLEIFKENPLSDIEQFKQGTMRTIKEIVEKDCNKTIEDEVKKKIYKYYDENGLRNMIFHARTFGESNNTIIQDNIFDEVQYLLVQVLSKLSRIIDDYDVSAIGNIKKLR